jgi:hypothetical protein
MAQLWSAHTFLLQAALQDRHAAQQERTAAEQATAAAVKEQQRLRQLEEDKKVALRAINDRHAAKAEAARQDYEQLKLQHEKVRSNCVQSAASVCNPERTGVITCRKYAEACAEPWAPLLLQLRHLRVFVGWCSCSCKSF